VTADKSANITATQGSLTRLDDSSSVNLFFPINIVLVRWMAAIRRRAGLMIKLKFQLEPCVTCVSVSRADRRLPLTGSSTDAADAAS